MAGLNFTVTEISLVVLNGLYLQGVFLTDVGVTQGLLVIVKREWMMNE